METPVTPRGPIDILATFMATFTARVPAVEYYPTAQQVGSVTPDGRVMNVQRSVTIEVDEGVWPTNDEIARAATMLANAVAHNYPRCCGRLKSVLTTQINGDEQSLMCSIDQHDASSGWSVRIVAGRKVEHYESGPRLTHLPWYRFDVLVHVDEAAE
jgi:hypothetical protein